MAAFDDKDAYVLLGAAGLGKTTAFKNEAQRTGGHYVTARDFATYDDRPEWHGATLFIDGLDEMRTGDGDLRSPLDRVRRKLERLERPRFRLSCRSAYWYGANDRNALMQTAPGWDTAVLKLEPLPLESAQEILTQRHAGEDAGTFIKEAKAQGFEGLLGNPQTLLLLADAFASIGSWPKTRREIYERACEVLADECNEEHEMSTPPPQSVQQRLNAAGRLCTILILSGSDSIALVREGDSESGAVQRKCVRLREIGGNQDAYRQALASRLFEAHNEEACVVPVHWDIAAFLSARYLAQQICLSLSCERILSLMVGDDGVTVAEMTGLAIWLAACSDIARPKLIECGLPQFLLEGGMPEFSSSEKRRLLQRMAEEAASNRGYTPWLDEEPGLAALAAPDMADFLRRELDSPGRSDGQQTQVWILLNAMRQAAALPVPAEFLLRIVRDESRWPGVREDALDVLIQWRGDEWRGELRDLLDAVLAGEMSDFSGEIYGQLLRELYLDGVDASELASHLRMLQDLNTLGAYENFWTECVPHHSSTAQLQTILDGLMPERKRLLGELRAGPQSSHILFDVPSILLGRLLQTAPEIDPERLFEWLGLAAWMELPEDEVPVSGQGPEDIRCWLNQNPNMQQSLITLELQRLCGESSASDPGMFEFEAGERLRRRLFGAEFPPAYGAWYLEQAPAAADPRVATYFVRQAAHAGLPRSRVESRLAEHPDLLREYDGMGLQTMQRQTPSPVPNRTSIDWARKNREWLDQVRQEADAIRDRGKPPMLLHKLAEIYFGKAIYFKNDGGRDRLRKLLGDESLREAVLEGFRGIVRRAELPTAREIRRDSLEDRVHALALPFAAGLEEIFQDDPNDPCLRDNRRIERGLVIWHIMHVQFALREMPEWVRHALGDKPHLAKDILIKIGRARMRRRQPISSTLFALGYFTNDEIARQASLPLLRSFPIRCKKVQLSDLAHLVAGTLRCGASDHLLSIVQTKLERKGMHVAQRTCWLIAGLLVAPERYMGLLKDHLAKNSKVRTQHLAEFLSADHFREDMEKGLNASSLRFLIEHLGSIHQPQRLPDRSGQISWTSPGEQGPARRIWALIRRLENVPDWDATQALESLVAAEALEPWRPELRGALHRHNIIRRETRFRYREIRQVIGVLDGGSPAGPGDLAAVVLESLREVAENIRHGNTSDWQQYWDSKLEEPLHENDCRNRLLSDLKHRMKGSGICVDPEVRHADEARSDICARYGDFSVPVEIKKSNSPDLWRAIESQLMPKYIREPGTGGYGILLAFWFGARWAKVSDSGERPRNPEHLTQLLRATIPHAHRNLVAVVVVDVANPRSRAA